MGKWSPHPKRDALAPQRIPREVQMQQSVTTQKTPPRIPTLCSTTGVCCWKDRRESECERANCQLLPTNANFCQLPMEMPTIANICRFLATFAKVSFFVPNSFCHCLNGGGAAQG